MREYLHDDDPYDEDALYAGGGQRVRTAPEPEPSRKFMTSADATQEDKDKEQGCKITIDFYRNGFMLNNHPPFHPFEGGDGKKLLDEMTHQGSLPMAMLAALPPEERPKPYQKIYTDIVNHPEEYTERPPEERKEEGFGDGKGGRTLGGAKAPAPQPVQPAEPAPKEKRGLFSRKSARAEKPAKGGQEAGASAAEHAAAGATNVPAAGPPTAPELHLVSGMAVAPVRVRTAEGTFTIQTNPDIHTPQDLVDALRASRHAVPKLPVFKRAGGERVSDLRATLGSQNLARQVLLLAD